jgi:colanic acid/amylovoran biosynthesis protein
VVIVNISIIGATLTGNKGAEAMLETTVHYLSKQYPHAYFNIFSYYPKQDSKLINHEKSTILDATPFSLVFKIFPFALICFLVKMFGIKLPDIILPQEVRILRKSKMLVDIGGITFSDGREKFLPFNVLCIWPAMLLGVKVLKLSQAMGPFNNSFNRLLAGYFLPRCKYVFARGEETLKNIKNLYGGRNASYAADLAFLYNGFQQLSKRNTEDYLSHVESKLKNNKNSMPVVGICPSSVVYPKAKAMGIHYEAIYANFINDLLRNGYHVILVPNAIREQKQKLRNNDLPVIKKIFNLVETKNNLVVIEKDIGAAGIKKIISLCDFFVASRFHSMIASLSLGIPTLVCGWGHKYFEVLDLFDLRSFAFDYRDLSKEMLDKKFHILQAEGKKIRNSLSSAVGEVKKDAGRQFQLLKEIWGD